MAPINPLRSIIPTIIFSALLAGCQMTSGQIRSEKVTCLDIENITDFRGSKPQWNVFGDIKGIQYCRASNQTQHNFKLTNGYASSQISNSDTVVFLEISDRVFREMISSDSDFRPIAYSTDLKQLSNDGRPTIYAIKSGYKRPRGIFVMNDGYPAADRAFAWSQVHIGKVISPTTMSVNDFELWFIQKIREMNNTGGDYSSAFETQSSNAPEKTKTEVQISEAKQEAPDTPKRALEIFGRWDGVTNNLRGTMMASPIKSDGTFKIDLPNEKAECIGSWKLSSGKFGTDNLPNGLWSMACENNLTASGNFFSEKPGHGLAEGQDSSGRKITFYYKTAAK